jgi:cyclopropane fatty-acyl-phospholipid synthase-like methyltransferase
LNKNLKQKKILDIGCGLSGNFKFFSLLKMKVFGLEISNEIKKLILKKIGKKI